jgi:hypothetical protein
MAKKDDKDLKLFLQAFDGRIAEIALWLRDFVWDLYPECNELIYDGPAALAFGWTPSERTSDVFSTIAIYNNECVQFGFYKGNLLSDPEKLLEGKGKQYRFIRVTDISNFSIEGAKELLHEAYINSLSTAKGVEKAARGTTTVRFISQKKRRPKPNKTP